jgi:excisionase family DNA binding protein
MTWQHRQLQEVTVSRRRRTKPVSSAKSAATRRTPPASSATPHNAVVDSQNEAHRLAVIAIDNGGSVGSALTLFGQAAEKVAELQLRPTSLSPDAMRREAAKMRREIAEATALAEAAWALRDAEVEVAALRRQLQRSISAEERRLEQERRRAEGGLYANQARSDGRPTRLAVDPEAWDVLKARSIRRRTSVGYLVGRLVVDAVAHNALPRIVRDDRPATRRFVRLIDLDVETWTTFRAMALDTTSQRLGCSAASSKPRRVGWAGDGRKTTPLCDTTRGTRRASRRLRVRGCEHRPIQRSAVTITHTNQPLPELLDITEVARHLGVNVRHVRRLIAERRIPFIKWGHLIRFDPAEIVDWLERNRRGVDGVR